MASHETYMRRCIALARMGMGYVAPNPLVGAVLVADGRIIGEGFHQHYGGAHAEVNCFNSVREEDKYLIIQATLYVSLEPCAHFGQTPPCADRCVKEGVKAVVFGSHDPFDEVNGKGLAILRANDIAVMGPVLEKDCRQLNERFFTFHQKQRPFIHLKWAQSADGFMGSGLGQPRLLISNPVTQVLVHQLRANEAAILVGGKTFLSDKPKLNNRLWSGRSPIRLIVAGQSVIPKEDLLPFEGITILWEEDCKEPLIPDAKAIKQAIKEGNTVIYRVPVNDRATVISQILKSAHDWSIQSILVEGGAAMHNAFINSGKVDIISVETNPDLWITNGVKAPILSDDFICISEKVVAGNQLRRYALHELP